MTAVSSITRDVGREVVWYQLYCVIVCVSTYFNTGMILCTLRTGNLSPKKSDEENHFTRVLLRTRSAALIVFFIFFITFFFLERV